jgi:hypothetical protein
LKADIAERCRLVNNKKAALDAKTDTSVSTQILELLERELEDVKECHTPVLKSRTEASICVPRMFKSHA